MGYKMGFSLESQGLIQKVTKAVVRRCSVKNVFFEILPNSQENTCARVSFLIKLHEACNFIKIETLAQVFFFEFCEISKNTFYYRTPLVAASELKAASVIGQKRHFFEERGQCPIKGLHQGLNGQTYIKERKQLEKNYRIHTSQLNIFPVKKFIRNMQIFD